MTTIGAPTGGAERTASALGDVPLERGPTGFHVNSTAELGRGSAGPGPGVADEVVAANCLQARPGY